VLGKGSNKSFDLNLPFLLNSKFIFLDLYKKIIGNKCRLKEMKIQDLLKYL